MKRRFQAGQRRVRAGNDEQRGKSAGVGEQPCPHGPCAVCAWLAVTFTAVSVVTALTGELGES